MGNGEAGEKRLIVREQHVNSETCMTANVVHDLVLIRHPPEDSRTEGMHVLQGDAAGLQSRPVGFDETDDPFERAAFGDVQLPSLSLVMVGAEGKQLTVVEEG